MTQIEKSLGGKALDEAGRHIGSEDITQLCAAALKAFTVTKTIKIKVTIQMCARMAFLVRIFSNTHSLVQILTSILAISVPNAQRRLQYTNLLPNRGPGTRET